MAVHVSPVKGLLRAAVAALLLTAPLAVVQPASAAQNRPFQNFRSDNGGGGGTFNLDQDSCRGSGRHRGRFDNGGCMGFDGGGGGGNGSGGGGFAAGAPAAGMKRTSSTSAAVAGPWRTGGGRIAHHTIAANSRCSNTTTATTSHANRRPRGGSRQRDWRSRAMVAMSSASVPSRSGAGDAVARVSACMRWTMGAPVRRGWMGKYRRRCLNRTPKTATRRGGSRDRAPAALTQA